MHYIRKTFLDASAVIAWLLHDDKMEPGGQRLSAYLRRPERQPYSNEPCLTEVLARLKWMRHYKEISDAGYFMRIDLLKTRIDHQTLHISEFNYWKKEYTDKALELVRKHQTNIDFIDALQIVDVLEGPFSGMHPTNWTKSVRVGDRILDPIKGEKASCHEQTTSFYLRV